MFIVSHAKRGIWIWCARTTTTKHRGRASGDSFLALGGGSRDAMGASRGNQHTCSRIEKLNCLENKLKIHVFFLGIPEKQNEKTKPPSLILIFRGDFESVNGFFPKMRFFDLFDGSWFSGSVLMKSVFFWTDFANKTRFGGRNRGCNWVIWTLAGAKWSAGRDL